MRTARGVWLSAGRRGWWLASAGGPSGGPEQSNLLEQRGRQRAVDSPIGPGNGSGSGGSVATGDESVASGADRRLCACVSASVCMLHVLRAVWRPGMVRPDCWHLAGSAALG